MQESPSDTEAYQRIINRIGTTLEETRSAFPYIADPNTGTWTVTDNGNWCGGHWVHLLWLAYQYTRNQRFADAAQDHTDTIVNSIPPRSMFCGMNLHYAGFRAYDITGKEKHREIGLKGADASVEFYNQRARQIPLGTLLIKGPDTEFRGPDSEQGPSGDVLGAVDAIYTSLPVLWRAFEETGNPVYRDTAISHADRHIDWYIREDGRTWHHAEFDSNTGDLVRQYNELAYSDDTC